MTPTLQGIRVIDAASFLAGTCAATIMSDYGADVIKIEPPGAGDIMRRYGDRGDVRSTTWEADTFDRANTLARAREWIGQ